MFSRIWSHNFKMIRTFHSLFFKSLGEAVKNIARYISVISWCVAPFSWSNERGLRTLLLRKPLQKCWGLGKGGPTKVNIIGDSLLIQIRVKQKEISLRILVSPNRISINENTFLGTRLYCKIPWISDQSRSFTLIKNRLTPA